MRTLTQTANVDYRIGERRFLEQSFKNQVQLIDFAMRNETVLKLVRHIRVHGTRSEDTCKISVYNVFRYSQWLGQEPDTILADVWDNEGVPIPRMLVRHEELVDDYVAAVLDTDVAPGTPSLYAKSVKAWYLANKLVLNLPRYKRTVYNPTRSPTPEELQKVLAVGDLRERTIVSLCALCAFRLGTLSRLTFGHVREDLQKGSATLTFRIKARETKGQYTDEYWTFARAEAVENLKLYLAARRQGTEKLAPEVLLDSSPLIRDNRTREVKPVTRAALWRVINNLYKRAGLIESEPHVKRTGPTPRGPQKRYSLRPHSLRYYFRTQLSVAGVNSEHAEFMLGHRTALYNDCRAKGIDFFKTLYERSGISIGNKTKTSLLDQLKTVVRSFGLDPERVLVKDAISEPHRIVVSPEQGIDIQVNVLTATLRKAVLGMNANTDSSLINTSENYPKVK